MLGAGVTKCPLNVYIKLHFMSRKKLGYVENPQILKAMWGDSCWGQLGRGFIHLKMKNH